MTTYTRSITSRVLAFLMLGMISLTASAQEDNLKPVSRTYAITNAFVVQAPGRVLPKGTVVISNGVITAVGQNVSIPPAAQIIEADSMYVYAGFIDGLSHIGVPKPKEDTQKQKVKDPGNAPNDVAGIEPEVSVIDKIDPKNSSISEFRKLGFVVSHVVPHGRMLPGQGAIILLTGEGVDQMVYRPSVSQYSRLSGAPGVYPNTVIGVMAKYRELYKQAENTRQYKQKYDSDAVGMQRPASNRALEAFYPVIAKERPVFFKAENVLDIQRALQLKKELGFDMIIGEAKQVWDIADQIKQSKTKLFLSLDLPELKEEEQPKDSVQSDTTAKASEEKVSEERKRLDQRKEEMIQKYYTQPVMLLNNGVIFGFSTMETKSQDFRKVLAGMIKNGLSEDQALAALTTHPAELLGLSQVMGTVDNGKMGNIIISDKPYFEEKSMVKYVFVDGLMYEYKEDTKTKTSGEEPVDVIGTWTYTTETPQGVGTGDIVLMGSVDNYSGTISSSLSGDTNNLSAISVDGNMLYFSFSIVIGGNTVTVNASLEITGDKMEGVFTVGDFGSFPVEGEKTPEK